MANLHEGFSRYELAEAAYARAWQLNPGTPEPVARWPRSTTRPCGTAGAARVPRGSTRQPGSSNSAPRSRRRPDGYYKVATFYWDKAYRDPMLTDQQKDAYADKGLEAVGRALELKRDYIDAIVYKGLCSG